MADPSHGPSLGPALVFLGAAVLAVPLFRFLGLGAVVGYLAAGLAIGPSGLGLVGDPAATLTVAELGVVLLLFLVGLELQPSRLLAMRRAIVGLGFGQMAAATLAITLGMMALGLTWAPALAAAIALAFSATSIALQLMEERGELQSHWGQRAFAILLFQDISVVPVLALVPLLAGHAGEGATLAQRAAGFALSGAAIAGLVLAGRYLLNPAFAILARSGAREVMTAAALLVALGAALLMQWAGMSMALGAFLAGLLLSESNFRHQLEADVEPFRGLLMGLFFMSVGMSIDGRLVVSNAASLFGVALAVILGKLALTALVMRLAGSSWRDSLSAASVLTPAGEFAFVIFPLLATNGLVAPATANLLLAVAALTMLAGPILAKAVERALARVGDAAAPADVADLAPQGARGAVLVIGFGRFGQLANQVLLAAGADVTVIDANVERIRAAGQFGFKIFYGDGARLDVLRAAGAETARVIAVCVDDRAAATRIVEMARANFPLAKILARAWDRVHAIDLVNAGVDLQIRETLESALVFGGAAVAELDGEPDRARDLVEHVRRRDAERLAAQLRDGAIRAGGDYVYREPVRPEPLATPARRARGLNPETQAIVESALANAGPPPDAETPT
ncbi:MAG: cation:proton antiporter [Methylobacteriaceae bacterium]|nr:cation:proton antiporter [Methylobacteriaceae bacterium]